MRLIPVLFSFLFFTTVFATPIYPVRRDSVVAFSKRADHPKSSPPPASHEEHNSQHKSQTPRVPGNVYPTFPDDDKTKAVFMQADPPDNLGLAERHVVIWWYNVPTGEKKVRQVVHLTGQAGNYHFFTPVAKYTLDQSVAKKVQYKLGDFSREKRDNILTLAGNVGIPKVAGKDCRDWMKDLLKEMEKEKLIIDQDLFTKIDNEALIHL